MYIRGSNFSTSSSTLVIVYLFYYTYSSGCKVASYCGSHLYFLANDVMYLFMSFLGICISSLKKCLFKILPIFNYVVFLLMSSKSCLFWALDPYQILDLQTFSPILWVVLSFFCYCHFNTKVFSLTNFHLSIFPFVTCTF